MSGVGTPVNFSDATKFYNVSTVNYLAAGSCNFNNAGVSLWPLSQIVADTQLYVRDAVIAYIKAQTAPIAPAIEGRLQFVTTPPLVTVTKNFTAAADTSLTQGQPNVTAGDSVVLYVGASDQLRAAVRFDLSQIAAGSPVEKAMLWLYIHSYAGAGTVADLQAFEITTPWQEATATWKTPWTLAGGDFAATPVGSTAITGLDAGKWVKLDVTELVQKWVLNPGTNLGALVRLGNTVKYTKYRLASREYWEEAMVPMLEVTYKAPMP